ncbi:hypothetical protein CCZ01_02455 [Helicobacter monodelphidis]|uniref:hypothetical protein n=1 Tax=Helicobacter sp. 15-1451 TaxID=2004995 RepID=UPI000DCC4D48|nr:hypothetical protein [Helicobacter sp. 15-1451]RAX58662.1 hypothetical protein CCZ01_02455 [Helicobacter sp. 15-1451]
MKEGFIDSLKRWRKNASARLRGVPFFDIRQARKDFQHLLSSSVTLPKPSTSSEYILSLTTFPERIHVVGWTLLSFFIQTQLPNRIILVLKREEFPLGEKQLPKELFHFQEMGLEILWVNENHRSYAKIIPILNRYPEATIITADDDHYYTSDWLEKLITNHKKEPQYIHAHRVHHLNFDENRQLLPYNQWHLALLDKDSKPNPSFFNFATGIGGVLYPPHCFYKDICDSSLYLKICPSADDIWLWGMEVLAHRQIKRIEGRYDRPIGTMLSQKTSLSYENVHHSANDIQIQQLLAHYPEILEILAIQQN